MCEKEMRGARILRESKAVDDEIRALDKLVEGRRSVAGRANPALAAVTATAAAACSTAMARVAPALPLALVFWFGTASCPFAGRRLAACRGRGRRCRVARTVCKRLFLLLRR